MRLFTLFLLLIICAPHSVASEMHVKPISNWHLLPSENELLENTCLPCLNLSSTWEITKGQSFVEILVLEALKDPDIENKMSKHNDLPTPNPKIIYTDKQVEQKNLPKKKPPPLTGGPSGPVTPSLSHELGMVGLIGAKHNNVGTDGISPNVSISLAYWNAIRRDAGAEERYNRSIEFSDVLSKDYYPIVSYAAQDEFNQEYKPNQIQFIDAIYQVINKGKNYGPKSRISDNKGTLFVIASGNHGSKPVNKGIEGFRRSDAENLLVVGSITNEGNIAAYTTFGEFVDLYAPSGGFPSSMRTGLVLDSDRLQELKDRCLNLPVLISNKSLLGDGVNPEISVWSTGWGTDCNNSPEQDEPSYSEYTGTSVSTSIVSAVSALMISVNPELTATEVKEILISTSSNFVDNNGKGKAKFLNSEKALRTSVVKIIENWRDFWMSFFNSDGNDIHFDYYEHEWFEIIRRTGLNNNWRIHKSFEGYKKRMLELREFYDSVQIEIDNIGFTKPVGDTIHFSFRQLFEAKGNSNYCDRVYKEISFILKDDNLGGKRWYVTKEHSIPDSMSNVCSTE